MIRLSPAPNLLLDDWTERSQGEENFSDGGCKDVELPKQSFTAEEQKALTTIMKDKRIVVLPADKGNATVVMDTDVYETKMKATLDDSAYSKV